MKNALIFATTLLATATHAGTPIDGWYANLFGGYAYIPNNLSRTNTNGLIFTQARYQNGYNAGGSLGYKSNPMRYEGELTYLNANAIRYQVNSVPQTGVGGYSNAVFGFANVYYDFPGIVTCMQPYLGIGLGYGWVHAKLNSAGPNFTTSFNAADGVFAYQAAAGLTFNFAENYAIGVGYRYINSQRAANIGKVFQANLGNLIATYRFDIGSYK